MKYMLVALMFVSTIVQARIKYFVKCTNISGGYTETYQGKSVKMAIHNDSGTMIFLVNDIIILYKPDVPCEVKRY